MKRKEMNTDVLITLSPDKDPFECIYEVKGHSPRRAIRAMRQMHKAIRRKNKLIRRLRFLIHTLQRRRTWDIKSLVWGCPMKSTFPLCTIVAVTPVAKYEVSYDSNRSTKVWTLRIFVDSTYNRCIHNGQFTHREDAMSFAQEDYNARVRANLI